MSLESATIHFCYAILYGNSLQCSVDYRICWSISRTPKTYRIKVNSHICIYICMEYEARFTIPRKTSRCVASATRRHSSQRKWCHRPIIQTVIRPEVLEEYNCKYRKSVCGYILMYNFLLFKLSFLCRISL